MLRRTFNSDLRQPHASLQPEREVFIAAASYRNNWRFFLDASGASEGTGRSNVYGIVSGDQF